MESAESLTSDSTASPAGGLPGHGVDTPGKTDARHKAGAAGAGRSVPQKSYEDVEDGIALLPPYTRSLLKVKLPVRVTLASTKQPLQRIVDLSPGSILQFNKPCDQALELEVGERTVALGQAVKVGDKFGLWITAMVLPEERFWVVNPRSASVRAK